LGTLSPALASGTGQLDVYPNFYFQTFNASSEISDLVDYFHNTPGGNMSASYDASTGQFSLTIAAGNQVDD
jgi:hypothetical protein